MGLWGGGVAGVSHRILGEEDVACAVNNEIYCVAGRIPPRDDSLYMFSMFIACGVRAHSRIADREQSVILATKCRYCWPYRYYLDALIIVGIQSKHERFLPLVGKCHCHRTWNTRAPV